MAKNDYFPVVFRILAYLYACLKAGEAPDIEYLKPDSEALLIYPAYWEYIMRHLLEDGYLEGVKLIPVAGRELPAVKLTPAVMITPKGIEFLQENSMMNKAKKFLKSLKELTPGL